MASQESDAATLRLPGPMDDVDSDWVVVEYVLPRL